MLGDEETVREDDSTIPPATLAAMARHAMPIGG